MSDTSEAPSLASHVRRVRVPSQASDVDQFLDDLFSPVLDPNIDEMSDARSLAASIKGGRTKIEEDRTCIEEGRTSIEEGRSYSQFIDSILNCEYNEQINTLNTVDINKLIRGGGKEDKDKPKSRKESSADSVDDYITNLFDPIFMNDSLKRLTDGEGLSGAIKGGGATPRAQSANTSLSFGQMPLPPTMPATPEALAAALGLHLPPPGTVDINAYHQNLQRAFLQNAMAQNIQIQQQLLAQNQALQTLLSGQVAEPSESEPTSPVRSSTVVHAQVHSPPRVTPKARRESSESSSPGAPPPPPPPMPPPLHSSDPSEIRGFMDPYGRAKTVRIGKWRWPPPKDAIGGDQAQDFTKFKMRQIQRRHTPQAQTNGSMDHEPPRTRSKSEASPGIEWEEFEVDGLISPPKDREPPSQRTTRRSFEIGAQRPSPGSVGKLKLSSEMRQRLERVTANHSVRSTSSNAETPRTVNKLEDTRKLMLERQLGGAMQWNAPPPPLPPAPPGPAPPPPKAPPSPPGQPAPPPPAPDQSSFAQLRRDRDTFGVHQNREADERHAFLANWNSRRREDSEPPRDDLASRFLTSDRRENQMRDDWGDESSYNGDREQNGRDEWDSESGVDRRDRDNFSGREASEIYEIHPARNERRKEENGTDDSFDRKRSPFYDEFDRYDGRKNSRDMLVGRARDSPRSDVFHGENSDTSKRATFKTHMQQKERDRKMEAVRRLSVSTHVTDKTEHIEREYLIVFFLNLCTLAQMLFKESYFSSNSRQ